MVLCAKTSESNTLAALLANLKLDQSQLTDISAWLKFQKMFTFSGADVTLDDIEIEKEFFQGMSGLDVTSIITQSLKFEWSEPVIQDMSTGTNYNLSDLAMVKYVTSQYDLCNTEKALSYRSMTAEKLNAFNTCLLEAIRKKNPQITNAENAINGFAAFKLSQLPANEYEEIGKLELSTHSVLNEDNEACDKLFEKRLLSFDDVDNDQYLVANPIFWNNVAEKWLGEKFHELNGESWGILMLYNTKSNNSPNLLEAFKKQFFNYFRATEFTDIDIDELEDFIRNCK